MKISDFSLPDYRDIKAGRNYMGWSQAFFAKKTKISLSLLKKIEGNKGASTNTFKKITKTFQQVGIVFHEDGGFKAHQDLLAIWEGNEGIKRFFDDVLAVGQVYKGEFLVSGVNEEDFVANKEKVGIDNGKFRKTMKELGIKYRIIISDKDKNSFGSGFWEYRKIPERFFASGIPFFIYGNKVAIMLWHKTPAKIIIIRDENLVETFRRQFNFIWENVKI